MTTLIELKTKYQVEAAELQRQFAAKEQALEDHRQEVLAEAFPAVVEYLSQREGIDQEELKRHGHIEGDWYSSGQLNYAIFHLEVPEHAPMKIRLYMANLAENNGQAEWNIDRYNSYRQLGEALMCASELYQNQQTEEQREAEREVKAQQREEIKAAKVSRRNAAKQRTFDQLANDPAALLLLKLFAQIQKDREALDEQIESLEEANASARDWHGEVLANTERKFKEVQQEISEVESRNRLLQDDVYGLEDQLKKAKRSNAW